MDMALLDPCDEHRDEEVAWGGLSGLAAEQRDPAGAGLLQTARKPSTPVPPCGKCGS
jgi:hypothetical protein